MPNHLKFCSCRMCRYGRHKRWGKEITKRAIRKNRRQTKRDLRLGRETVQTVSVPYTD